MTPRQRKRRLSQLPRRMRLSETGCWEWTGYIDPTSGYGRVRNEQENMLVHRMVYELAYGEIESGVELHHECGNRACANPYHLRKISKAEHCLIHLPPGARWKVAA